MSLATLKRYFLLLSITGYSSLALTTGNNTPEETSQPEEKTANAEAKPETLEDGLQEEIEQGILSYCTSESCGHNASNSVIESQTANESRSKRDEQIVRMAEMYYDLADLPEDIGDCLSSTLDLKLQILKIFAANKRDKNYLVTPDSKGISPLAAYFHNVNKNEIECLKQCSEASFSQLNKLVQDAENEVAKALVDGESAAANDTDIVQIHQPSNEDKK